jgi:glutathione S-transferase
VGPEDQSRRTDTGQFDTLMNPIPLPQQRDKWQTARAGFSQADLAHVTAKIKAAIGKTEQQLARTRWLAGAQYTLADVNFFAVCDMALERMFPEFKLPVRAPCLTAWVEPMRERPGVTAAFARPDRTNPALRTFSGEAR